MLAYDCKQCKKITIGGYVNEFDEHFCSEKCYKKYCEKNNYVINWNNLKEVKTALSE